MRGELREATKPGLKLSGSNHRTRKVEVYLHVSERNIAATGSPLDDLMAAKGEKGKESDRSFPPKGEITETKFGESTPAKGLPNFSSEMNELDEITLKKAGSHEPR